MLVRVQPLEPQNDCVSSISGECIRLLSGARLVRSQRDARIKIFITTFQFQAVKVFTDPKKAVDLLFDKIKTKYDLPDQHEMRSAAKAKIRDWLEGPQDKPLSTFFGDGVIPMIVDDA